MKRPMPYAVALALANRIKDFLHPACERICIVGSLRRKQPMIGDIDLLLIPKLARPVFGQRAAPRLAIDPLLPALGATVEIVASGALSRRLIVEGTGVDLWLSDRAGWAVRMAIRTGSADFSHWLVCRRRQGGPLPDDLHFDEARLWRGNQALEVDSEEALFDTIGLDWIPPEQRDAGRWSRAQR